MRERLRILLCVIAIALNLSTCCINDFGLCKYDYADIIYTKRGYIYILLPETKSASHPMKLVAGLNGTWAGYQACS